MVSMEAVQKGIANYVDKNLLSQMTPTEKVLKGGMIGIYLNGLPKILNGFVSKAGLDKIGVVTEQGIDIEVIKNSFTTQVQSVGQFPVSIPWIGTLTFDAEEIEKIYKEIINV